MNKRHEKMESKDYEDREEMEMADMPNINVELSHVRLLLPESHAWFDFRGTLGQVNDTDDLAEGFQSYLNKRIQEAASTLSGDANEYSKVRALVNLKQSRQLLENNRRDIVTEADRKLALTNESLLLQAEQQAQQQVTQQQADSVDNRGRLNSFWRQQDVQRSKNVVSQLGSNFDVVAGKPGESAAAGDTRAFNQAWFEQNQLQTRGRGAVPESATAPEQAEPVGGIQLGELKSERYRRSGAAKTPATSTGSAPTSPAPSW